MRSRIDAPCSGVASATRVGRATAVLLVVSLVACSGDDGNGKPVDDGSDTGGPLITRDSYEAIVAHVFDIYVGDVYNAPIVALMDHGVLAREANSEEYRDGVVYSHYDCEIGSADRELIPTGTNAGEFFDFRFDGCGVEGVLREGTVSANRGGYASSVESSGMRIEIHPQLATTFSGSARQQTSDSRIGPLHAFETTALSVVSRALDGNLTLSEATTRFAFDTSRGASDLASMSGGFTLRSSVTGERTLRASVPIEFAYAWNYRESPESSAGQLPRDDPDAGWDVQDVTQTRRNGWFFSTGQLELVAQDGSSLLLDADTGRADTVRITLDDALGAATSVATFQIDWLPWQERLRFKRFPIDRTGWVEVTELAVPDPAAGPAITVENHQALLDLAIDVLTGVGHAGALGSAQEFLATSEPVVTRRDAGVRTDEYRCSGAGSAVARRVDNDASLWPLPYELAFTGCDEGGWQFDGVVRGDELRSGENALSLESNALEWVDGEGRRRRFSGRVVRRHSAADALVPDGHAAGSAPPAGYCLWSTDALNLSGPDAVAADDNRATISTSTTAVEVDDGSNSTDSLRFTGSATFLSADTGGHAVSVSTSELSTTPADDAAIDDSAIGGFASGGLYLSATDGSRLFFGNFVDHDGDDSTRVVIDNVYGRFKVSTPWTSWRALVPAIRARLCGE